MNFIKMYLVFTVTFSRPGERSALSPSPSDRARDVPAIMDQSYVHIDVLPVILTDVVGIRWE